LEWKSVRYKNGQPLIGHSKGYKLRLDVAATPMEITLTRSENGAKEMKLGIYKVDGDTLKTAFGTGSERPKKMDDPKAELLTLKRIKE
jgi:uncharacterized protein (TIGR03067 family)